MNELKNYGRDNYYTEFSCKKLGETGREVVMGSYSCFSAFGGGFRNYLGEQEFRLRIYKEFQKLKHNYNHFCLFSLSEIIEHINDLFLVLNDDEFNFNSIIEDQEKYELRFRITSDQSIIFGFALTWIRYLYELPYSLALHESFLLKEKYKNLDPFSRFNLARTTFPDTFEFYWGNGHSATKNVGTLISPEELRKRLHSGKYTNLNSIYKENKDKGKFKTYNIWEGENNRMYDLDFWIRKDEFDKRVEIYKKNLNRYEKRKN
jgi:hypothetical protein